MDLTGNTLSHANTCKGGTTPPVRLVLETTTSYYVEIGLDGVIYIPDPEQNKKSGLHRYSRAVLMKSMGRAKSIRCSACDSHRVFGKDEFDYKPQIKWGKHAPTLENTIIKAMTAQQPNTPVNMRMVERLASEIQGSWLMQPTVQEQELQERG
jgi:hypothetical protein